MPGDLSAAAPAAGFLALQARLSDQVIERQSIELVAVKSELVAVKSELAAMKSQLAVVSADLAAVNSELEAFSYSVSHDLRAPLRAMNGFARIMADEYADLLPPEAMHYLRKVTDNAQQMGSLMDALLSFSRVQRQSLRSAPIDMTELVRESWTSLADARAGREIDFVLPKLPTAMGDRRLIEQVWRNLLDNAIKYTGGKSRACVEVAAQPQPAGRPVGIDPVSAHLGAVTPQWIGDQTDLEETDNTVLYTVKDNGAGFDMAYVKRVGQVFQRLHHSTDFTGTGIGLALVQRIVQRHGGRLSAVGEIDAGATFGFTLRTPS